MSCFLHLASLVPTYPISYCKVLHLLSSWIPSYNMLCCVFISEVCVLNVPFSLSHSECIVSVFRVSDREGRRNGVRGDAEASSRSHP